MYTKRLPAMLASAAILAFGLPAARLAVRAESKGDHWVGTWATAVVARRLTRSPMISRVTAASSDLARISTSMFVRMLASGVRICKCTNRGRSSRWYRS